MLDICICPAWQDSIQQLCFGNISLFGNVLSHNFGTLDAHQGQVISLE